jgi:5'-3' exonuclease
MGIPVLFKQLSEKYNIIQTHIDNNGYVRLFLDLNGAIHPVCRNYLKDIEYNPIDKHNHETIMVNILITYVQTLIVFTQANYIFIAIDGVAPFGKIIQQKSRRMRKSKDGWDTNQISPGTDFMYYLQTEIQKSIENGQIKPFHTLSIPQELYKIIFSNSNIPGEGEHKIMAHLKTLSSPETKHITNVIYGLDADLIMLSMSSRENNIYLLREEITFKKSGSSMDEKTWGDSHLYLNIDMLKQSINNELITLIQHIDKLQTNFSLDNTTLKGKKRGNFIDDYIFISFLLGNDFLPHPLTLNLRYNGMEELLNIYVKSFIQMNGTYLIQNGQINTPHFRYIIDLLERDENKRAINIHKRRKNYKININGIKTEEERLEFINNIRPQKERREEDFINIGKHGWRNRYKRVVFPIMNNWERDEICDCWCKTLLWNLKYYYDGCPQQNWIYGYSCVPTFQDLQQFFKDNNTFKFNDYTFKKGIPCNSLSQLLCIMPKSSKSLLPRVAHSVMMSEHSNLRYLYPSEYQTHSFFKKYEWECEPVLPLINITECKDITAKLHVPAKEKHKFKKNKLFIKSDYTF